MKLTGRISTESVEKISRTHLLSKSGKIPRIWILIADSHLARIFRKNGSELELIGEAEPSGQDTSGIHTIFGREIAAWLADAVELDAFDRLVMVAAPQMLNDLRKVLPSEVQARIVADVSRDLAHMREPDLREELEKIVWF